MINTSIPSMIRVDGVRYARTTLTYEEVGARGAVEVGMAYDSSGKAYPGWADKTGRKYAEVSPDREKGERGQVFMRIDNKEGWRWEWDEGTSQEDVDNFPDYM